MAAETSVDQDPGMPTSRPSSAEEHSLAASAHELQRAAGNLLKHAADADQVPDAWDHASPISRRCSIACPSACCRWQPASSSGPATKAFRDTTTRFPRKRARCAFTYAPSQTSSAPLETPAHRAASGRVGC